jgi:hypothetical protein
MTSDDPGRAPRWWGWIRRVVTFVLGVWVIVDSLVEKNVPSVGKLIVGLVMIGVLPLDDLLMVARRTARSIRRREED